MSDKYGNFVRPSASSSEQIPKHKPSLNGEQAKRLYLEEVLDVIVSEPAINDLDEKPKSVIHKIENRRHFSVTELTDKDLFLSAQNNDVDTLIRILDNTPDKINIVDEFGWSLLMIACQANSIEVVRELLKRDIDTLIRDRAGNSARTLVIKNKNLALVDMFLSHKSKKTFTEVRNTKNHKGVKRKREYTCDICNNTYPDETEHLSSTVHNINISRGKKIPTNYVIPVSNRGYQIMLKGGWDKETGLGPDGSGKKYPLRTTQKKDRKGLGHEKVKQYIKQEEKPVQQNKKILIRNCYNNRNIEINFRRQFY